MNANLKHDLAMVFFFFYFIQELLFRYEHGKEKVYGVAKMWCCFCCSFMVLTRNYCREGGGGLAQTGSVEIQFPFALRGTEEIGTPGLFAPQEQFVGAVSVLPAGHNKPRGSP